MRNIKPLSHYMSKKVRMYGRARGENTFSISGSLTFVTLPWDVASADLLEVYYNGSRQLDNWSVSNNRVTFAQTMTGQLDFVEDAVAADSDKWLQLDIENLVHYDDTENSAYGTDRRSGPKVAQFFRPLVMVRPGIGFCRPSDDNQSLLYSNFYLRYGRDSVTYAIRGDDGQMSDLRCIDIRVKDPDYIPSMRLGIVSQVPISLKVNDQLYTKTTETLAYEIICYVYDGDTITVQNRTGNAPLVLHTFIQGKDEDGDWFEPTEYFDDGEYVFDFNNTITYTDDDGNTVSPAVLTSDQFTKVLQGDTTDFGFEEGERLDISCTEETTAKAQIVFGSNRLKKSLLTVTVTAPGISNAPALVMGPQVPSIALDPNPYSNAGVFMWQQSDDVTASSSLISVKTIYGSDQTGALGADMQVVGSVTLASTYYNPAISAYIDQEFDYSQRIHGVITMESDGVGTSEFSDTVLDVVPGTFVWETNDPFSPMYTLQAQQVTITVDCEIVPLSTFEAPADGEAV